MHAWRDLVDQQPRPAGLHNYEHFDRQHTDIIERGRDSLGDAARLCGKVVGNRRGRARRLEDVIAVFVFGDVEAFDLTVLPAGGDDGNLALERHEAFENRGAGGKIVPDLRQIVAVADNALAFAVIAESPRLDNGGQADFCDGRMQRLDRRHVGIRCRGDAERGHEILFCKAILSRSKISRAGSTGRFAARIIAVAAGTFSNS